MVCQADAEAEETGARRIYRRLAQAPTQITGRFYSVVQVSDLLGVSKQRVLVFLKEGRLTGVMVGNVWLVAGCSVERLAEMREGAA